MNDIRMSDNLFYTVENSVVATIVTSSSVVGAGATTDIIVWRPTVVTTVRRCAISVNV